MGTGTLAAILIKVAVAVLQYYHGRADFREKVLLEVRNAGLQVALAAERYKANARLSGTPARFGVRGGATAKPKPIQAENARPHD